MVKMNRPLTIEQISRRLKPVLGEKIEALYFKYLLAEDFEEKKKIEQALRTLYKKHLAKSILENQLLLSTPQKETIRGDYPLGTILYGDKSLWQFGLRKKDWIRHVCVTGMSGSGKTTFAFQILGNFIFKNNPFLVFDWKRSFRPLMMLDKNLVIYTIGNELNNFKVNINQPPRGVPPKEWISFLADLLVETFNASFGTHKILIETMHDAFRDFGVFAGSNNYPTWHQIKDRLEDRMSDKKSKSRESEWLESALRIAHIMTYGSFGEAINYKGPDSSSIEDLMTKKVVFELASLSNTEKKIFTQYVLAYFYKFAKAGNLSASENFNYAIVVDEAHNIFLKDRPRFITESITDVIFREIREYGIGLIVLDQHISRLSEVVAGNSATIVAFQQVLPADLDVVSRLMHMEEEREMFTKLEVGQGIVKLVERHHDPFLIQAPNIKLKNHEISDEVLREEMNNRLKEERQRKYFEKSCETDELKKKLSIIMTQTGVEYSEEDIQQLSEIARQAQENYEKKQKRVYLVNHLQQKILLIAKEKLSQGMSFKDAKKHLRMLGYNKKDVDIVFQYLKEHPVNREQALSDDEKKLLQAIINHPNLPITEVYKKAGFSARKGHSLRQSLEEKKVVTVISRKNPKGWTKHFIIN